MGQPTKWRLANQGCWPLTKWDDFPSTSWWDPNGSHLSLICSVCSPTVPFRVLTSTPHIDVGIFLEDRFVPHRTVKLTIGWHGSSGGWRELWWHQQGEKNFCEWRVQVSFLHVSFQTWKMHENATTQETSEVDSSPLVVPCVCHTGASILLQMSLKVRMSIERWSFLEKLGISRGKIISNTCVKLHGETPKSPCSRCKTPKVADDISQNVLNTPPEVTWFRSPDTHKPRPIQGLVILGEMGMAQTWGTNWPTSSVVLAPDLTNQFWGTLSWSHTQI